MPDELSVRQWQEQFRAGAFDRKDIYTQISAGWRNWHCHGHALAGRLKKIAPLVMGIKAPFVLDNYSIGFSNERPGWKMTQLYDTIQFEPIDGLCDGTLFTIEYENPYGQERLMLYTQWHGLAIPEYGCRYVRDMVKYISDTDYDLEHGIHPPFMDEKAAAVRYIMLRPVYSPTGILQQEGEHSYSFLDRDDGRRKTVHVARGLEDVPPEAQAAGIREINGLFVYCPEDAGVPLPEHPKHIKKSHKKKKEAER